MSPIVPVGPVRERISRSAVRRALEGALAGIVGTGVLALSETARARWVGSAAVYAPAEMVERLARRFAGRTLPPSRARRIGRALRWIYGPSLGALYALVRPRWPRSVALRAIVLGASVATLEAVFLPRIGATPPFQRWTKPARRWLPMQTTAFGLATEVALRLRDRSMQRRSATARDRPALVARASTW